ncbi:lamin tail domain-containing protein [Herbidospora galbida]|uniref:Lamin tail domain-containing protein n=1 Tax=Herbidospora galbida TaxID=2575442 RepID=A0A4U3MLW0_9ACTN|nr:lamin tail domain-containing protein [Herbidospora galbida]TKK90471.1 lamin tail domain-containing protein [Herbidospora galbida]
MKRVLAVALLSTAVLSQPAQAKAPAVQITKIFYDSPGSPDNGANSSVNGEYIQLKNVSKKAVSLTGWTVQDETKRSDHVYTFTAFTLKPGKTVTLRSGKGKNTATTRYWQRSGQGTFTYIWNQTSDTGYLRNAAGKLVDSCSYNSSRDDYVIC